MCKKILLLIFLLTIIRFDGYAQPTLIINNVSYRDGKVQIQLNVLCDGIKRLDLNSSNFEIIEQDIRIIDYTISCSDSNTICCKTIGFVNSQVHHAEYDTFKVYTRIPPIAFIEKMNQCDEAAYITFDPILVKQTITHDTIDLKNAIRYRDPGTNGRNITGAIITAIHEAEKGSNNMCKGIIVYTGGPGGDLSYSYQQAIDSALAHGYSIYILEDTWLGQWSTLEYDFISTMTGGKHFNVDTTLSKQVAYMRLIYNLINNQNKYCTITYNNSCKDGTTRNVEITVNKCGGTARQIITYTVPYDPKSFIPVTMKIDEATVTGGETVSLPITISPQVNALFHASTFRITYDPSCCIFLGLDSTNSIFKGLPLTVQTSPGVINIATNTTFMLDTSGVLTTLRFKVSDPEQDSECLIRFASWAFDHGCLSPTLIDGKITINARKPILDCSPRRIELPDSLAWNRILNNYDPNPFSTLITITNTGNREARNVKAKITLPSDNSLLLAGPTIDTQPTTPSLMKINSLSTAAWIINAKERMKGDSLQVCIDVWADNHPTIQCCKKIYIPVVGARLACALSIEKIKVDTKLNRYTPMPFTIIDTVKNTGGLPTDTVFTTIILPQGLTLANVPNNSQIKRAQPIKLNSQMRGTALWQLYHPITIEEKKYTVTICNRTRNADSVCCDVDIIIPQIDAPVLECTVTAVDSLFYNEAKDEYNPNPFPFTVAVKNNGSLDADSVRATLVLPLEFMLEPPTQPTTKYFNPMLIVKYTPTLPSNEVSWMVKALDQKKKKASAIKVKLNGVMR